MKKLALLFVLFALAAHADTPPSSIVKAKTWSGDGNTSITATGSSLNVNVTNPISITGSVTATNSANGATGSAVPSQATQVAGSDGTNLRALKVSTTGVLSTDGSASTQPISAASLPLPSGAATAAAQATLLTALGSPFQVGGSIGNTAFGISGTLPAYASTPTFNLGTLNGAATATLQSSTITALGSPFQAGGSIGNSAFGISGTLPAFAATPTFNLGTLNGASTAANQATEIASLATIATNTTSAGTPVVSGTVTANQGTPGVGAWPVLAAQAGSWTTTVTQGTGSNLHTVVDSSALPTGAATSAAQTTAQTSLTSIDGKTPALGQALSAASVPVVLPAAQITTLTPPTTVTVIQPTGSNLNAAVTGSVTANAGTNLNTSALALDTSVSGLSLAQGSSTSGEKGVLTLGAVTTGAPSYTTAQTSPFSLTAAGALRIDGSATTQPVSGTFWQATQPVSGTFWQATQPVSATSLPLPTGAATSAAQTTAQTSLGSIVTNTGNIPAQGQALAAGSMPVVLPAAQITTLTPPTSVTVTQATAANLNATVVGTVTANPGTPTALTLHQAAVSIGTSAVRLTYNGSAPASTRVLLVAQLLSTSTANCYLGSSGVTTTSTTRGPQMFAGQLFSFSNDAGDYYAICDAVSQTFLITEQE